MKSLHLLGLCLAAWLIASCGSEAAFEKVESSIEPVGEEASEQVSNRGAAGPPASPPDPSSPSPSISDKAQAEEAQARRKAQAERAQREKAALEARLAREKAEQEAAKRQFEQAEEAAEAAADEATDAASDAYTEEEWAAIAEMLNELEPAAGGAPSGEICQAETQSSTLFLLTCYDQVSGKYRQAQVKIGSDPAATLTRLQRQLAGPRFEVGIADATLCYWGDDIDLSATSTVFSCLAWDPRLSEAATAPPPDDGSFDEGRIAHHAPSEMVLNTPYFLEIAIQPLTRDTTLEAADISLSEAVGTGRAPASEDDELDLEFATIKASELMTASLVGTGFDITRTTADVQPLIAGEATVWQWEVIPRTPGAQSLTFSMGNLLTISNREVVRTVKTLPLSINVEALDALLADPLPQGPASGATREAAPALPATANGFAESAEPFSTRTAESVPTLTATTGPSGCETLPGTDPNRHALLLTNLAYETPISRLSETHRDGERLTLALRSVGFSVTHCRDLGQRSSVRALSALGRSAKARSDAGEQAVTFFYYSGHGANVDGTNYILPIDLYGADPTEIRDGAVTFEDIFNRVSSTVAATSFVVFDACRTVMDDQSRGIVSTYRPVGWPSGVFQAFATAPGQVAADSGVYSTALSGLMVELNDPANVLFKRVQDLVTQRTGERQRPVYTDGTTGGDFYFKMNAPGP